LTFHKNGDTTDCAKLTFEDKPIVLNKQELERFLKDNIKIKLNEKDRRIQEIKLKDSDEMFGQIYYIKKI